MCVLITGSSGFISSHLGQYLLDRGNEVRMIDDLSAGSTEGIPSSKQQPGFRYTVSAVIKTLFSAEPADGSDVAFNLAPIVGARLIESRQSYGN